MALPVITVASGGLAVVEVSGGMPVTEAPAGYGTAVTKVTGGKPGLGVAFVNAMGGPAFAGTAWSQVDKTATCILTSNNLQATGTAAAGNDGCRGVRGVSSGKYYVEYRVTAWASASTGPGIALSTSAFNAGIIVAGACGYNKNGNVYLNAASQGALLGSLTTTSIVSMALDADASPKVIYFRVAPAGNWNNNAANNPATGVGGINISAIATGPLFPFFSAKLQNDACLANFGSSSFVGAVPSGYTPGWPA